MRPLDSVVVKKMTEMPFGREMRYDSKEKRYYFLDHNKQSTSWDDPRIVLWKEWADTSVKLSDTHLRDERIIITIHPNVSTNLIRYIFSATNYNVHDTCKYLSDMGYKEVESLVNAKAKLKTCLSPKPPVVENASTTCSTTAPKTTTTTMAVPKNTTSSSSTPRITTPKTTTPQTTTPKLGHKTTTQKTPSLPYNTSEMQEDITKVLQILEQSSFNRTSDSTEEIINGASDPPSSSSSSQTNTPRKSCYVGPDKNLCKGPNPAFANGPDPCNLSGPDPLNVKGAQGSFLKREVEQQ